MNRRFSVVLAAVSLASVLLVAPTYAVESAARNGPGELRERTFLPAAECRQLKADVLKHQLPSDVRGMVMRARDSECWTEARISWGEAERATAFNAGVASAASFCRERETAFAIGLGNWEWMHSRTRIRPCSTGSVITGVSYQNCWVTTPPFYFGGADEPDGWCGWYYANSARSKITAGNDFWVSPYSAPWWKRFGYYRFDIRASDLTTCCIRGSFG